MGPDEPHTETLVKDKGAQQVDGQLFLYQRFNLFSNRLILSAGGALFSGVLKRTDDSNLPAQGLDTTRNQVFDTNFGVILQPLPGFNLFAGYNRVGGALPTSITAGEYTSAFKVDVGDQWEYGVKTSWLNGRLTASVAYFEITQSNSQLLNPRFQLFPLTEPPYLYVDLRNRGWETEIALHLTREFEPRDSFTRMHMRDAFGVPQLMVPDQAGALFGKYTFHAGKGKGLGLSFGLHYWKWCPATRASESRPRAFLSSRLSIWRRARSCRQESVTVASAGISR